MHPICTLYLVRHGQSRGNEQNVYGLDLELTEKGKQQVLDLKEKLKNVHFDAIICSTMLRSKQSADLLAQGGDLKVIQYDQLHERYHGMLEGNNVQAMKQKHKDLYEKRSSLSFEDRMNFKFSPDYESDKEVVNRVLSVLQKIASENIGKTVLIVSHIEIMKPLLTYLGYASHTQLQGESIDNSGYVQLTSDGKTFRVQKVQVKASE